MMLPSVAKESWPAAVTETEVTTCCTCISWPQVKVVRRRSHGPSINTPALKKPYHVSLVNYYGVLSFVTFYLFGWRRGLSVGGGKKVKDWRFQTSQREIFLPESIGCFIWISCWRARNYDNWYHYWNL